MSHKAQPSGSSGSSHGGVGPLEQNPWAKPWMHFGCLPESPTHTLRPPGPNLAKWNLAFCYGTQRYEYYLWQSQISVLDKYWSPSWGPKCRKYLAIKTKWKAELFLYKTTHPQNMKVFQENSSNSYFQEAWRELNLNGKGTKYAHVFPTWQVNKKYCTKL